MKFQYLVLDKDQWPNFEKENVCPRAGAERDKIVHGAGWSELQANSSVLHASDNHLAWISSIAAI